jgi:hypothetical protein
VTITVERAAKWKPSPFEGRSELRVDYRCPTCGMDQSLHLQPLPWSEPVVPDGEDAAGRVDHTTDRATAEVAAWERRRAAGEVEHRELTETTTQLWCHRCQAGTEILLRQEG